MSTLAEWVIKDAHERGLGCFFGIPGSGAPMDLMDAARDRLGAAVLDAVARASGLLAALRGADEEDDPAPAAGFEAAAARSFGTCPCASASCRSPPAATRSPAGSAQVLLR